MAALQFIWQNCGWRYSRAAISSLSVQNGSLEYRLDYVIERRCRTDEWDTRRHTYLCLRCQPQLRSQRSLLYQALRSMRSTQWSAHPSHIVPQCWRIELHIVFVDSSIQAKYRYLPVLSVAENAKTSTTSNRDVVFHLSRFDVQYSQAEDHTYQRRCREE